jgi:tRNA(Ile2) C34 agmatinyltransferase TiaS
MILTSIETLWPENAEWQGHCAALSAAERLTAMVWIAFAMGMMLARTLLETELNQRRTVARVWPACPDCGKRLRSKGYRSRRLQTIVGEIH